MFSAKKVFEQQMGTTSGLRDRLPSTRNFCCGTNISPAENRILRIKLPARLRLSDTELITLAEIGKRLGRRAFREVACVAKPGTILAWYRGLVAQKFDGSKHRQYPTALLFHQESKPWLSGWRERTRAGAMTASSVPWRTLVAGCRIRR